MSAERGLEKDSLNETMSRTQDYEKDKLDEKPSDNEFRKLNGWKWASAVLAFNVSILLFSLDNTIVAEMQPSIGTHFDAVEKTPWLGAAFILGSIPIIAWGKCYGLFDMKSLYCGHVLLFEIGCAVCGSAPNMTAMIIGRAIAGCGGSGMYTGTLTYIAVLTTPKEKPRYLALIGIIWGFGTVIGPVIGGAFVNSSATWRWGFYFNLVLGVILAPVLLLVLPSFNFKKETSFLRKLAGLDWLGMALFFGGTACFILATNFGRTTFSWQSGREIALWTVSGVLLIGFGLAQHLAPFIAPEARLYPAYLSRFPNLLNLQAQLFLSSGILYGAIYYIPLYLQFTKGETSLDASVKLLPFILFAVTARLLNGFVMSKYGYYMPWFVFGSTLSVVGSALMYTISPTTSLANVYGYTILLGAGVGAYVTSSFAVSQCMVSPAHIPNVVAVMCISQTLGIVIFFSVIGATFQNRAFNKLSGLLPDTPAQIIHQALAGTSSDHFRSLSDAKRVEAIAAITDSLNSAWLTLLVASAICLALSLLLGRGKYYDAPKYV